MLGLDNKRYTNNVRMIRMATNNTNAMIKNIKNKKISVIIVSVIFLFSAMFVFAADYIQLVPEAFKGFESTTPTANTFANFLAMVFNFGIAAAVVLALIMTIWGGITYMTTDSWMGKAEGIDKIKDAGYGLGLALVSWLILYTINPRLVIFTGNKFLGLE